MQQIADAQDGIAGRRAKLPRFVRVGAAAPEAERAGTGVSLLSLARHDVEKVEHEARLPVRRHERAAPLVAHDDALGDELVDRLAQRAYGNLEVARELGLGGQRLARRPLAARDAARQAVLYVAVERGRSADFEGGIHARRQGNIDLI